MAGDAKKSGTGGVEKKTRNRSPAHPSMALGEAIRSAKALYESEGFSMVPPDSAITAMGFAPTGSSGIRALAALNHFGLLAESKNGTTRRVGLSDLAKIIVLAPEDRADERDNAIRVAALSPKIYKTLWGKYGGKLPSDNTLEYDLIREFDFNRDSVRGFIKDFRSTIAFAKPVDDDMIQGDGGNDPPPSAPAGSGGGGFSSLPKQQKSAMPPVGLESQPFDLPIPLIGGGMATLRMPRPISGEDYDHMVSFLEANLKALKRALVKENQPAPAEP